MAHAEKCPVCEGTGQVWGLWSGGSMCGTLVQCHGCEGKGWVAVGEPDAPAVSKEQPDPWWYNRSICPHCGLARSAHGLTGCGREHYGNYCTQVG